MIEVKRAGACISFGAEPNVTLIPIPHIAAIDFDADNDGVSASLTVTSVIARSLWYCAAGPGYSFSVGELRSVRDWCVHQITEYYERYGYRT